MVNFYNKLSKSEIDKVSLLWPNINDAEIFTKHMHDLS